jgi:hypothetical protein
MGAAAGDSAAMNVNSGGPHILLFERDQQLTALLTSEFQLAGYECHAARTAVEVFDAIARYPIRLVLVNLALAAAGRREFWEALDGQRRGRGVQVLMFRCMNIAGYGPDDSDEASRTVLADMEVDGIMGVMNLVDAVRSRIPGPTTGSFSRFSAIPGASTQEAIKPDKLKRQAEIAEPSASARSQVLSQATAPLSIPSSNPPLPAPPDPAFVQKQGKPASSFTDKLRAIIYPGSRSFSPTVPPQAQESGLSQLSQMVRDSHSNDRAEVADLDMRTIARPASPLAPEQEGQQARFEGALTKAAGIEEGAPAYKTKPQQNHPVDAASISELPLRASPIQDMPVEREHEYRSGHTGAQLTQSAGTLPSVTDVSSAPPVSSPSPITTTGSGETMAKEEKALEPVEEKMITSKVEEEDVSDPTLTELPWPGKIRAPDGPSSAAATADDTLLNIVQSFPPMPSPPPQPQTPVLSGRATRSLGSVLLEGHLVPQHRLMVAQNIQRMLRGVDLNYQLGEILLMFKLLTPDQLLAASLVSYGLISAAQISALGRIRQELHSIGLEYDLESLLVLFRILTPEELREVRASWSG